MRAVDTNVLARYYLADDQAQARIAKGVLESGAVFVPKTVMLELSWVLRSVAEQPALKALECLRHLAALPGVIVEDAEEIQAALELCAQGLEFADALHLCASSACAEMLTFDDRFVRRASKARPKIPVTRPASIPPTPPAAHQKRGRYRSQRR